MAAPLEPIKPIPPKPISDSRPVVPAPAKAIVARDMQATDLIDKAGLGPVADVAIVSILAVMCGVVLLAAMRKILTMGFGDNETSAPKADAARKQFFELKTRAARAEAKVAYLTKQAESLEK